MDWTLFGSALLSSTLFPGGSEALLLYRLHQGADPLASVLTATAGNVLGDVGDSHNQHAQRLRAAVAMGSKRLTELGQLGGIARMTTR